MKDTFLMFVDIKDGTQSNKFYNMFPEGETFRVEYGRMGSSKTTLTYPIAKWRSTYNSKVRKGYKDITNLKVTNSVVKNNSGNKEFDEFYNVFAKYTGDIVRKTYIGEGCTKAQLEEAQYILNKISNLKKVDTINRYLFELFKVIPRKMGNVKDYIATKPNDIQSILKREQDALDSMDSSNIMNVSNPFKELNIQFREVNKKDYKTIEDLIYPTKGNNNIKIHKVYGITQEKNYKNFTEWLDVQDDKTTNYLIHGTRNPNIFSILKSGLMIRPTNAAVISGAAYGNGIYHSAHTAKSLGYTGYDSDKLFLIQNVHMGKEYVYNGWYRDGKDISRNQMNYNDLKKLGYDSLFVKPGDGLLNSEYIVYKEQQSCTSFLVWLK